MGLRHPSVSALTLACLCLQDPAEVGRMAQALDDVLVERNKMIRELQYMVIRAAKVRTDKQPARVRVGGPSAWLMCGVCVGQTYNDSFKTYSSKLNELGIPQVGLPRLAPRAVTMAVLTSRCATWQAEIADMGFEPIPTTASVIPAGLVAK